MTHRPFRFGLVVYDAPNEVGAWRELARRAEGLGYSSLLIGDHFVLFEAFAGASPLMALQDAASVTTTLRVGTAMMANDFRHPAVLAKDAATLDVLSGGRLELGVGAGWFAADYAAVGIPLDPPMTRLNRLEEAIAVIKSAWSGSPFDFAGGHYTLRAYAGRPRPMQQPRPPIAIGGGSPRILRLAAREADIVGLHSTARAATKSAVAADMNDERMRQKLAWVTEAAAQRIDEIELQLTLLDVAITDQPAAVADQLSQRFTVAPEVLLGSALTLIGSSSGAGEELQRRRSEYGTSYITVPAQLCDDFAPVVSALAGV